jgi:molybdate transport system ATP-binding protein
MKALTVRAKKAFGHFSLDVSWDMEREILVLFGPSGSGKSVTLQVIAGLLQPDEGYVASEERVFHDSSTGLNVPPQQRSVGYVFQDRVLFPHMTVRQNIAYGLPNADKSTKVKMVSHLVSQFRLKDVQDKHPDQISGGQKQRVTLARALIGRPKLLLLDEPFSALDNNLRSEMHNLLLDIRRDFDVPIVLVTHDLLEAYALADKVVLYGQGRISHVGSPQDIFYNPSNPDLDLYMALNLPLLINRPPR